MPPDSDEAVVVSDNIHDTDILSGDHDSDGESEGSDDLTAPHIIQYEQAVWQVTGQKHSDK